MASLLDANVFIQSKNDYYAFDVHPGFWEWLDRAFADGRVCSVEAVRNELVGFGDELSDWAAARPAFFLAPDEDVLAALAKVSAWTNVAGYPAQAVATFLAGADYYLVGHALAKGDTIVTLEKGGSTKRIKIPDACAALKVQHVGLFPLLKAAGVKFVLSP